MAKLLIQLHLVAFRLISRTLALCLLPVNHLPVVMRCLTKGFTLVSWKGRRGRPFHPGFMRDRGLAWSPRLSHHRARTVAWATEPVSARTGPRRTHVY